MDFKTFSLPRSIFFGFFRVFQAKCGRAKVKRGRANGKQAVCAAAKARRGAGSKGGFGGRSFGGCRGYGATGSAPGFKFVGIDFEGNSGEQGIGVLEGGR